ncbi:MAG: DUF1343 domain-containing protein [Bacteroidales bacterium]|nr:DUF1343 domain-containing protein [Bacteroidales bacterium]MCF8402868.1 DUF1343 domain-containing protein [Bacteroidales bacterium]
MIKYLVSFLFLLLLFQACSNAQQNKITLSDQNAPVIVGAERLEKYLPLLPGKRVAIMANQTSMIGGTHLVDSLLALKTDIVKVFGTEHGFRGNAADGAHVSNETDAATQLAIISLYGNNKKPTPDQLMDVDVVIFDIQDVGARFYTYISAMTYMMEACAENNKKMIVLDRPNPNGDYVDGPVLDPAFSSFVGLHPVPVVHGMTVGEYAKMVNGEAWLKDGLQCDLVVIPCKNYSHNTKYHLPIAPSPNLPNMTAIYLYPSLCFFEGTVVSVGRGTAFPFQVIGHPSFALGSFAFTPVPIKGVSDNPPQLGKTCFGQSLAGFSNNVAAKERRLHLNWLIDYYTFLKDKTEFFTPYFSKLAGSELLQKQIEEGFTEDQIKESWKKDLNAFKTIRKKYLLYEDFE